MVEELKRKLIPVIGCSGDSEYRRAWIDSGAKDFLFKPFRYDLLLDLIHRPIVI